MNEQSVGLKFTNNVTGQAKLDKLEKTLTNLKTIISSLPNKIDIGTSEFNKDVSSLNTSLNIFQKTMNKTGAETKKLDNANKKLSDSQSKLQKIFSIINITAYTYTFRRLLEWVVKGTKASANYTENLNLMNVAFDDGIDSIDGAEASAQKFINTMSEVYNLDESRLTRSLSIFKQLTNAMKLPDNIGNDIAEIMVKMENDISSLYNISLSRSNTALQGVLTSQTKPIRAATGADITENSLQLTLNTIGVDKYIRDLTFAEKRVVALIAVQNQLKNSQADWAKTIESTANQIKIFQEQTARLTRAFGDMFIPILQQVLPYLNAIVMVLTEIFSFIAGLLGFEQQNFGGAVSDSVADLEEQLNGATGSAGKLKDELSGLRSFDKLNVINTPTEGGGDSGGGSGLTSVDENIIDALKKSMSEYEDMMDSVQTKASKIRDDILEWLGFTKQVDETTGDVSFKFERITFGTISTLLGSLGLVYGTIRKISGVLSKAGLVKKLPSLFSLMLIPLKELGKLLSGIPKFISWIITGVGTLISSIGLVPIAIGLAIAGAIALVWVFRDEIATIFKNIGQFFIDYVINPIVNFFTTLGTFVYEKAIAPIIGFFKPIVDSIVDVFKLIIKNVTDIVVGVSKAIFDILAKIGEIFLKIVEIFAALGKAGYEYIIKPIVNFIVNLAKDIYEKAIKPIIGFLGFVGKAIYEKAIKPIFDFVISVGSTIYEKAIKPLWDKFVWLKNKVVDLFKGIATTVVNFATNLIKSAINGVFWSIEFFINIFIRAINKSIGAINKIPGVEIKKINELKIQRLKTGMDFVPKDFYGPVYLDYGERVLTKEENEKYSQGEPLIPQTISNVTNSGNQGPVTINLQVGTENIGSVMLESLEEIAKTNGKPITIGG